jgi:serine/threonine-protein kinase RsbW
MKEEVNVTFPADTEYLPAVRLLSSAVASKGGFDMDCIEDIKLCAAEACMLLLCQDCRYLSIDVRLHLEHDGIEIMAEGRGNCEKKPAEGKDAQGLGESILQALTDHLNIDEQNGIVKSVIFTIKKT